MLLGWGVVGVVYTISGLQDPARAIHLAPGAIDRAIRFDPDAIWVYMSFFLIVPLGYLASAPARAFWLCRSMILSAIGAGIAYALFPTTMSFPPVTGQSLSETALRLLMANDTTVNCAPSLHVTLTALAVAALWRKDVSGGVSSAKAWLWNRAILIWGGLILFSILQLYRHQFIDLVTGLALAGLAGGLAWVFARYLPPFARRKALS
ncbi:inositol phosphorylceramide synthase [Xinfangfangia sp. D13-10-4-6]|nr:inositol phosphorylceramide synthase [Pseudogemmobacter hezensis]